MVFFATRVAAVAVAISVAAVAGCRRRPVAESDAQDAGLDHPAETAAPGDGSAAGLDATLDAMRDGVEPADTVVDLGPGDTRDADGSVEVGTGDAPADVTRADTPADVAGGDAPPDVASGDTPADVAPADGVSPDRMASDAGEVRPEEQPCGPLGFHCAPYACNLALGNCKTFCASDDDCVTGRPCVNASCGRIGGVPCFSDAECNSGFCARGSCCMTPCNQVCASCGLPATIGTCTLVPDGAPDPYNRCPPGSVCNGRGQCAPTSCTVDADCGDLYACTDGQCMPCHATCVTDADCAGGPIRCIHRNACTQCNIPDAGGG